MKYILAILSSLVYISNAYAYLDPGTGSLVIQSSIAAITGGLFIIKTYWYKIKEKLFFRKNTITDDHQNNEVEK